MTRGAVGDISSGASIASAMTSRIVSRASAACWSARRPSTEAGMPSSLVSSCSAVTNSLVPATLKSMSPNASSAPRMSVSATYCVCRRPVGDQAHRDARDRRLERHTGVEQRHRRGADRAHRGRAVGAERLGDLADRVRELLAAGQHRQRAPARRARRGRSRDASASRPGRSHRSSTAGSCSCACSACGSPATSVSSCCSMRSMFSVVTPRIWVSPRSNSAEPCTRGSTSTSADSVRMSVSPRPSMRTLSRMTRSRTSFLVSER